MEVPTYPRGKCDVGIGTNISTNPLKNTNQALYYLPLLDHWDKISTLDKKNSKLDGSPEKHKKTSYMSHMGIKTSLKTNYDRHSLKR